MEKITKSNLRPGYKVVNTRNKKEFEILDISDNGEVLLKELTTSEQVGVKTVTLIRWYRYIVEEPKAEVKEESKKPARPPRVSARRPKVKKPSPVIVEEIEEDNSEPEKVDIVPKPKKGKSSGRKVEPKSESNLAIVSALEKRIAEEYPASKRGVTSQYVKFVHKFNFVNLYISKSTVRINVITRAMPKEVKEKLTRIVPESYDWTMDGFYKLTSLDDIDQAMEFIAYSHKGAKG